MSRTFAGISLKHPVIMGIVNATPDSFSDAGDAYSFDDAVSRGMELATQGAAIIDVGGESTRPGADPVSIEDEIARTAPVIERLVASGITVSIDTRHGPVMEAAIQAGASIINDVTALTGDEKSIDVAANSDAHIVLMHMQGTPGNMQSNPSYIDASVEVFEYLKARVAACVKAGITIERIAVDPGIGFGKNLQHNLKILKSLDMYKNLGATLLLGVSRKSFIGEITDEATPKNRLAGSLAAGIWGVKSGFDILRVHDVAATADALKVWTAIENT